MDSGPCLLCGSDTFTADDDDKICGSEPPSPPSIALCTLVKLVKYPHPRVIGVQGASNSDSVKSEVFDINKEEFDLCQACTVDLEEIGLVLAQLEELHLKVTEFQRKVSSQLQSVIDIGLGLGCHRHQTEALITTRRRILHELESRSRTNTINPADYLEIGHSQNPQQELCLIKGSYQNRPRSRQNTTGAIARAAASKNYQPVPVVRLLRLEEQFPVKFGYLVHNTNTVTTTDIIIKQEPAVYDKDSEPYHSEHDHDPDLDSNFDQNQDQIDNEELGAEVEVESLPKRGRGRPRKGDRHRYAPKKVKITPADSKRDPRVRCQYPECTFKCMRPTQLPPHVESVHLGDGHGDEDSICGRCGAFFPDQPEQLAIHVQAHAHEEKSRIACPYCPRTYPDYRRLRLHWKAKHPKKPVPPNPNPAHKYPAGHPARKRVHPTERTCPHCQRVFPASTHPSIFKNHLASHTRPYKCEAGAEDCNASFGSPQSLRGHYIKVHPEMGIQPFACPHVDVDPETGAQTPCSFTSAYQSSINTHVKAKHASTDSTTGKRFLCTAVGCDAAFIHASLLRNHVEKVHEGKKNFLCTQCGLGFYFKDRLRVHMRVHTGEKPYVCSTGTAGCGCGKEFRTRKCLRAHEALHRGEHSHVCEYCGMGYPTKGILAAHLRSWHKVGGKGVYVCKRKRKGTGTEEDVGGGSGGTGAGGVQRVGVRPKSKGKYGEPLPLAVGDANANNSSLCSL